MGSYLCTAETGYDGPTGLGTPIGVDTSPSWSRHGQFNGTITDAASVKTIAGAAVRTA